MTNPNKLADALRVADDIESIRAAQANFDPFYVSSSRSQTWINTLRTLAEHDAQPAPVGGELADALDHIARVAMGSRTQTTRMQWIAARAKSAIAGDDSWRQADRPRGYHDALERIPQPAPAPVQACPQCNDAGMMMVGDAQGLCWCAAGDKEREARGLPPNAHPPAPAADGAGELPPIERDEAYERDYIPLPGGWEIQTKGKGSTFRVCDTKTGERAAIPDERLHPFIERMAREVRAAIAALRQPVPDAVRELPPVDLTKFRGPIESLKHFYRSDLVASSAEHWGLAKGIDEGVAQCDELLALIASQPESRNAD